MTRSRQHEQFHANSTIQLPDAPLEIAPKTTAQVTPATAPQPSTTENKQVAAAASDNKTSEPVEELPAYVPAPKSLVSDRAASEVAAVNVSTAGTQNAVLSSLPKAEEASLNTKSGTTRVAQLSFLPSEDVLKIGEKRRYAIQLDSDVALSLALLALRFDPKVVKVHAVSAGSLLGPQDGTGRHLRPIDRREWCLSHLNLNLE
jgi:hypothetical protein